MSDLKMRRRDLAAAGLLAFAPVQALAGIKVTAGRKAGSLSGGGSTTTSGTSSSYCGLSLDSYGRDNFGGYDWNVQRDKTKLHPIQEAVGVSPVRHRFEVRSTDSWNGETTRNRAEFGCCTRHAVGEPVWFSYAMRVRSGPAVTNWYVLGQFHSTPDTGDDASSPPFSINLIPGEKVRFIRRFDPAPLTTVTPATTIMHERTIARERWYRIVGRVVFGWENNGAVDIWWDGAQVVSLANTNIGYNDLRGPYWKFGVYRAKASETLVVDYANMELGAASLLGRVTTPLAI